MGLAAWAERFAVDGHQLLASLLRFPGMAVFAVCDGWLTFAKTFIEMCNRNIRVGINHVGMEKAI